MNEPGSTEVMDWGDWIEDTMDEVSDLVDAGSLERYLRGVGEDGVTITGAEAGIRAAVSRGPYNRTDEFDRIYSEAAQILSST